MNQSCLAGVASSLATMLVAQAPDVRATPAADAPVLAARLNQFGADLAARAADPSLCQSPASIGLCLLMTLPGARGETAAELHKLLCPDGWDEQRVLAAASALLAHLRGAKAIELSVVNDLWPQDGHPLLEPFLAATRATFATEVRPLDFVKDPDAARKTINEHVSQATRLRIRDLLPPDAVRDDTRLVLTNALFLKAAWRDVFKEGYEGSFRLADGSKVNVPLMNRLGEYALAEIDGVQVLRLPYLDTDFALEVALPAEGGALVAAEAALRPAGLGTWTAALKLQPVSVTLPRFRVEGQFSLLEPLRAMGLAKATTAMEADFSGIDGGVGKLYIGAVVHRTFIEVGEKGTEAAAATAVVARYGSLRKVASFRANRPFAFALRDLKTGLLLFAGRVADPRARP